MNFEAKQVLVVLITGVVSKIPGRVAIFLGGARQPIFYTNDEIIYI